jgi:hypothetical protein
MKHELTAVTNKKTCLTNRFRAILCSIHQAKLNQYYSRAFQFAYKLMGFSFSSLLKFTINLTFETTLVMGTLLRSLSEGGGAANMSFTVSNGALVRRRSRSVGPSCYPYTSTIFLDRVSQNGMRSMSPKDLNFLFKTRVLHSF